MPARPQPPRLPPVLQKIADLTSPGIALRLSAAFGGRRVEFPQRPRPGHRVVKVIGERAARILGEEFMGVRVKVPLARYAILWPRARKLRQAGRSYESIAAELLVSPGWVEAQTWDIVPTERPRRDAAKADEPLPLERYWTRPKGRAA
jgi:hypothetical protein